MSSIAQTVVGSRQPHSHSREPAEIEEIQMVSRLDGQGASEGRFGDVGGQGGTRRSGEFDESLGGRDERSAPSTGQNDPARR